MLKQKCSIVITYLLLENESGPGQYLTQTQLANALTRMGCPCDRKTVGRDLRALQEMGCPIKKTGKGFYMDRKALSADEVTFVLESVRARECGVALDKDSLLSRLSRILRHHYT